MKQITPEQLIETVQQNLDAEKRRNTLHKVIAGLLAKWEGKKITARVKTQIAEALPGARVYYEAPSIFNGKITVYDTIGYKDPVTFFLNPVYTAAEFERQNASTGTAAQERIARREALLKTRAPWVKLACDINQLNAARESVANSMEFFADDRYAIERLAGLCNEPYRN